MIKSATVSARIDEKIKNEAENILQQLGIPVSVVINTLYHQIIIQKGVPFSMMLTNHPDVEHTISQEKLDRKLQHSYEQVQRRQGRPVEDVFADIERKHSEITAK